MAACGVFVECVSWGKELPELLTSSTFFIIHMKTGLKPRIHRGFTETPDNRLDDLLSEHTSTYPTIIVV